VKAEDFFTDMSAAFKRILEFLDVPPWETKKTWQYNEGHYPPMDDGLRKWLVRYYEPYNQKLYKYLGENFGWN